MGIEQDYRAILVPTDAFKPLTAIVRYKEFGHKKKLFKGECIRTKARSVDDPYFYYIDEGQIVSLFENESGEGTPVLWRNAGNAFSAECFDFASIGRYQARFVAKQNTVLFAFSQKQLYDLMRDDPELFYEFVYVCHMSFAQMAHRLSNTGSQSAVKRLSMWLQKLCVAHDPEARRVVCDSVRAHAAGALGAAADPHHHLHQARGPARGRRGDQAVAHRHPRARCGAPGGLRAGGGAVGASGAGVRAGRPERCGGHAVRRPGAGGAGRAGKAREVAIGALENQIQKLRQMHDDGCACYI